MEIASVYISVQLADPAVDEANCSPRLTSAAIKLGSG